jgi:Flp pilus assembly protein TadG
MNPPKHQDANGQRGQALIEFAFIILVMALLALGVGDFALAIQQGMLVQEAATAGALYASFSNYNATQTSAWQSAATTAGIGANGLNISTSSFCMCSIAGGSVPCSTSCSTGYKTRLYVSVTASSSFASMFPFQFLPSTFNLSSTVVMEVQ